MIIRGLVARFCHLPLTMEPIFAGISQLKWTWFSTVRNLSDIQIFDSASRGIFGSLQLMYHVNGRYCLTSKLHQAEII